MVIPHLANALQRDLARHHEGLRSCKVHWNHLRRKPTKSIKGRRADLAISVDRDSEHSPEDIARAIQQWQQLDTELTQLVDGIRTESSYGWRVYLNRAELVQRIVTDAENEECLFLDETDDRFKALESDQIRVAIDAWPQSLTVSELRLLLCGRALHQLRHFVHNQSQRELRPHGYLFDLEIWRLEERQFTFQDSLSVVSNDISADKDALDRMAKCLLYSPGYVQDQDRQCLARRMRYLAAQIDRGGEFDDSMDKLKHRQACTNVHGNRILGGGLVAVDEEAEDKDGSDDDTALLNVLGLSNNNDDDGESTECGDTVARWAWDVVPFRQKRRYLDAYPAENGLDFVFLDSVVFRSPDCQVIGGKKCAGLDLSAARLLQAFAQQGQRAMNEKYAELLKQRPNQGRLLIDRQAVLWANSCCSFALLSKPEEREIAVKNCVFAAVDHDSRTEHLLQSDALNSKVGSFILYNSARMATLLEMYNRDYGEADEGANELSELLLHDDQEWHLITCYVLPFPDLLVQAMCEKKVVLVARFLQDLASEFSSYYRRVQILTDQDSLFPEMHARMRLVKVLHYIMRTCMAVLNMTPLRRM
eukprot:Clim_evm5s5 gene=Clim_evmTU5s5